MNELFKSIYNNFTAIIEAVHNDFYIGLDGRLYYGQAPQGCVSPYAVFFGVSSVQMDTFSEKIDEASIQFNIYSNLRSFTEVGTLQQECRDLYDLAAIEVPGNKDVILTRSMSIPPWKESENVWISTIEFEAFVQED